MNPEDAQVGTYYLIARADALCEFGDYVVEKSETNNDLTGDQITMLPSTAVVDLTISNLIGPTSVVQGAYLRLDTYIANLGPDTAPCRTASSCGHITAFYLSKDTTITTSDTLIGSICLNDLAGKTTYRFWMDVQVPATLPTGRYCWDAIADYTKVLVETNETNNAIAVTKKWVTVTAPK